MKSVLLTAMSNKQWAKVAKIASVVMVLAALADAYLGQFALMIYCIGISYYEAWFAEKMENKND